MRIDGRKSNELRMVKMTSEYILYPEGSVLVEFGNTKVICNASFTAGVPPFLKDSGKGWVTGEYAMLPRATNTRNKRESQKGRPDGRSQEISRLIGRSLRAAVDMNKLGENTIVIDCDVIQADGGTRTAAITGGFTALAIAVKKKMDDGVIAENPIKNNVAAVSVGIFKGTPVLDLNYHEDSQADTDMNIVASGDGRIIEIQGSAEQEAFTREEMNSMIDLAFEGFEILFDAQNKILETV